MHILIVEDEDLYADQLVMLVEKMGYTCVGIVDNSQDALFLIQEKTPDLILMDVHIQGNYDGIEVAQQIRDILPLVPVIFVTSMTDDMTFRRASRISGVQSILKPFSDLQLQRAIELAVQGLKPNEQQVPPERSQATWTSDIVINNQLFVKIGNRLEKIQLADILYIEADDKHCYLHLPTKRFVVQMSLKQIREQLGDDLFFQSHRSFLINLNKIETINLEDQIIVFGEKTAPVSKRNKETLLKRLKYLS